MSTYKTPGAYVQEISLFPPSVAAVETAIPAFIGYTAKAKKVVEDDLHNVPTKIGSVLEFVEKFGGAPEIYISTLELDALNQVSSLKINDNYYLYECIRIFYANGGGYCYIVSVGKYGESVQNGTEDGATPGLLVGLNAIRKVDEPTLLVVPDAVLMSQTNINTLYQAMLSQCNELQDRFSIFDLRENDSTIDHDTKVSNFRDGIGMNYLKYGAAYTPWIKASLPRSVNYRDIKGKIAKNGNMLSLDSLVSDPAAKLLATRLDNLVDDIATIRSATDTLIGTNTSINSKFEGLFINLKNSTSANARARLIDLLQYYVNAIDLIRDVIKLGGTAITLKDKSPSAGDLKFLFDFLLSNLSSSQNNAVNEIAKIVADSSSLSTAISVFTSTTGADYSTSTSPNVYFGTIGNNLEKIRPHIVEIGNLWISIRSALDLVISSVASFAGTVETAALNAIPTLKTIYRAIEGEYLTLPPSSTIAGVYARVDGDRGVWKSPANVSLNRVASVTELIDNRKQDGLNVDVVAGKSINAIRAFAGKGTLVWGARTLAGNDNEWRYINVRRFFNFAEESIKKATEPFVFEPNDANTWAKVKSMIVNFLTLQWRDGALQGAKPDHAFYVKIGLGETMTALDILEGRMIVEVGMAVVRPAEFIILRFSHKLPES